MGSTGACFKFEDEGSEMSFTITTEGLLISRATKGMTPFLRRVAEIWLTDDFIGTHEQAEIARNFVGQSDNLDIIVGREMCG